mmetsp:Transcript_20645/g.39174  ORF Transcript_20645/g.39174 Transcript_20645/m.39174 type:complete len:368 (+) Transcript_20645:77-1180(+)
MNRATGTMAKSIFMLPTDVPAVVYEGSSVREILGTTPSEKLEAKSVLLPQSLQELSACNTWASEVPRIARTPPGLLLEPLPAVLPEPSVDATRAVNAEPVFQPKPSPQEPCQEELEASTVGTGPLLQQASKAALDCQPAHKELGLEVARLSLKQSAKTNRWWTMPRAPMICPFSGFPINLLPYPPFKLRKRAADPNPHSLVDGKYFALLVISTGNLAFNGRCLEPSEVDALSKHIHRCKLGAHRPDIALSLAESAHNARLPEHERAEAVRMLGKLRAAARCELGKLRRIQEQRLFQLHERFTSAGDGHKQESAYASRKCDSLQMKKQDTSKSDSDRSTCTGTLSNAGSSSEPEDNWEQSAELRRNQK